jgi:hypothetical protein
MTQVIKGGTGFLEAASASRIAAIKFPREMPMTDLSVDPS